MVYVLTVKLSAGCMVLMGMVVLMSYLIRNYYISGWLIYPFAAIDIFNPDWKVPLSTLQKDSALIKTYGRWLYNPNQVNVPLKQ